MNNYSRVFQNEESDAKSCPQFFDEIKFEENQQSHWLDMQNALRSLKESPVTAVWDLKVIVNRHTEDDFDEEKKKAGEREAD